MIMSINISTKIQQNAQARSAAAEALLREKTPPREMKMGLGWAVLHVDVVVYTEDPSKSQPKRVRQHMEWSNFWSTYQVGWFVFSLVWPRLLAGPGRGLLFHCFLLLLLLRLMFGLF